MKKSLAYAPFVLAAACAAAGQVSAPEWKVHGIPLFVSSSHPTGQQGFVRVINRSDEAGEVHIDAVDDTGVPYGPVTLAIGAGETVHFNSGDLEDGNAEKDLSRGIGAGDGDWRLRLRSQLDLEVLAYNRTSDGLLAPLHDLVPGAMVRRPSTGEEAIGHRVAIFNPASNVNQISRLRIINRGKETAAVTIEGIDDDGGSPGTAVEFEVPAGASRTVTAKELEAGEGEGLAGMLDDGRGKWQLVVVADQPLDVMSLLSNPTGQLTNLSTAPEAGEGEAGVHDVPLFAAADNPRAYQGFVRVINRSDEVGTVSVEAFDAAGDEFGPVTFNIGANEAVHFNSGDLEDGNDEKGLTEGVGTGDGDWRLAVRSDLDIEVLAYNRTHDGLLTTLHDLVPYTEVVRPGGEEAQGHHVAIFNPASNVNQISRLRIINRGEVPALVTIEGIDDAGASPGTAVELTVPAGASRTLTAQTLESGQWESGIDASGGLGDGKGKWRLAVTSDQPLDVMSLLSSPTGHLVNLSTVAADTQSHTCAVAPDGEVDYSQPSHDLQASLARTNWLTFRHQSGAEIAYGDFDGDGDEDVFLLSPGSDAEGEPSVCFPDAYCFTRAIPVEIWENVDNSFVLNTRKFFSGNVPEVVNIRKTLIGDFNGDGKPDIFVATHGPAVPPLPREEPPALFLSTDNGLVPAQGLDHLVGYNHSAASADIDKDGDLDIFVTDTANDPFFLINDGTGNFERNTSAVPSAINDPHVDMAELVDVDSDGYPDLLIGGPDSGHGAVPMSIYWGSSSGVYSDSSKTILPRVSGYEIPVDIDVGDLDCDGNKDIVVNRTADEPYYSGYYIQVISGLGNRTYSDTTSQSIGHGADATGRWIVWLRLVDVNGDGVFDITTDGDRYFGVAWLNDGSGRLAPASQVHRPFLHDWIRPVNGLSDTLIRERMNALVRSSDLMIHMDMESVPTMGPVLGTVGFDSLEHGIRVAYQEIYGLDGVSLAIGYRDTVSETYLGYGGWIDHSMFSFAVRSLDGGFHVDAYSLGVESGINPVSGSATWNGPVVGVETTVLERGGTFRGFAEVNVDFANAGVDVAFTVMRFHQEGNVVRSDITWSDLPLKDGKFGSDSIQGAFYGPNHEEVGVVFSRDGALGAFGGTRE